MESVMDLEIIEEEKGVGITDNHNFHGSVYGDRCMGQRDEWLKMYSGESGTHQCPSRHWQHIIWNTMAGASVFCAGAMTEYMADTEKGY